MGSEIFELQVRMFGELSLNCVEAQLSEKAGRSKKVWALIAYLLANRGREVSQERMMEELWPEGDYDDPAHVLKNLAYRARNMLKGLCSERTQEWIRFENNTYVWNKDIPCCVDAEEFERFWNAAKSAGCSEEERISNEMAAFQLYAGEYLPGFSFHEWAVAKNAYFSTLYRRCVLSLMQDLTHADRATEAIYVGEKAVGLCPFEEEIHRLLMSAYTAAGRPKQAIDHYHRISERFLDEFGVGLSEETVRLYKEIVKNLHDVETDLVSIKEDLMESNKKNGAFFCDYDIFKNIYRLYARSMLRNGASIYVGLLTLTDSKGDIPPEERIKTAMDGLRESTVNCLRKGDVVALYSSAQLVLMLPYTSYENGQMVLRRVVAAFTGRYQYNNIRVETMLQAVDPLEEQERLA